MPTTLTRADLAGINLGAKRPTPDQIRTAVQTVLTDERCRHHARRIQHDAAQLDAPQIAADLIERLAVTGRPVHRDHGGVSDDRAGLTVAR